MRLTGQVTTLPADLSTLEKALQTLEDALSSPPKNDLERDGVVQRFEYCFELSWKSAKRIITDQGLTPVSPKAVIRELGRLGWIFDVELWFDFLRARNESTYTYQKLTAEQVFQKAQGFPAECRHLLDELKKS
ncbi:MAG: HI0074 family nucleotidyltransferase substrate-binding subunit [Bdellovibrionota bacterium]